MYQSGIFISHICVTVLNTLVWCKSIMQWAKCMSAGNAHKIFFLELKCAQELTKMSYEKQIFPYSLYVASLNPLRLYICPQIVLSCRTIAFYLLFAVLQQQGLVAAGRVVQFSAGFVVCMLFLPALPQFLVYLSVYILLKHVHSYSILSNKKNIQILF